MRSLKTSISLSSLSGHSVWTWLLSSKLAACGIFLLGLTGGIYLFMPLEAIHKRISYEFLEQASLDVSLTELRLVPLLTLKGQGVEVALRQSPQQKFSFSEVSIDPWWLSLMKGVPGIDGEAYGLGGEISFRVNSSQEMLASASGLQFELPVYDNPQILFASSQVDVRLEASLPLHLAEQGFFDLSAGQARVKGLSFLVPDVDELSLGTLSLRATARGGSLEIERVAASGGAFEVTGSGNLLLAPNLPDSRINLNLSVKTNPQAPSELVSLIDLIRPAQADGSYRLRLTGTIARPIVK
jgi:type II secretion system protein N